MPPKPKKKPEEEAPKTVKVQVSEDTIRSGLTDMALSLVGALPYLIYLDLGFNPINSLASLNRKPAEGEEITYWPRLQFVLLNNTKIDKITPIAVPNLIKIDLSHNNISSVAEGDEGFKGYETIQELNISHTSISNLVPFKGMAKLKRLEASHIKMIMLGGLFE